MSTLIQCELASPQKMVFNKPAVLVNVPGGEGCYGVMAGHAPMATTIGAGFVEIYENDESTVTQKYFITGGYCETGKDRCTILADKIFTPADLKRADVEAEIADLEARAFAAETEESRETLQNLLASARAKLQAAS